MAAVVIVSDSDECGLDEDGIGKSLSKEDWERLVEKKWLTDKVNTWDSKQIGLFNFTLLPHYNYIL